MPFGGEPLAGVAFDKAGNIYGTTSRGPLPTQGVVFKLGPTGKGTILHFFRGGHDGADPLGDLVLMDGALYGTTSNGPSLGGTIFKVDPATDKFTTVFHFQGVSGSDGREPSAGLTAWHGELYGTTAAGGAAFGKGVGTIFRFDPVTRKLTKLHRFTGKDGATPTSRVVFGANGALYGTTSAGGAHGFGTVFKFGP